MPNPKVMRYMHKPSGGHFKIMENCKKSLKYKNFSLANSTIGLTICFNFILRLLSNRYEKLI